MKVRLKAPATTFYFGYGGPEVEPRMCLPLKDGSAENVKISFRDCNKIDRFEQVFYWKICNGQTEY